MSKINEKTLLWMSYISNQSHTEGHWYALTLSGVEHINSAICKFQ